MNETIKSLNILINELDDLRQKINWTENTKSSSDFIDLRLRVNEIIERTHWIKNNVKGQESK